MTRAIIHLFRSEWAAAWALHPLAPFLVLVAGVAAFWWVGAKNLGWKPIRRRSLDAGLLSAAMLFLAVWALRLSTDSLPPVSGLFSQ